MRARTLGLVAVAVGALVLGLPAHAVTPLNFADPAGDALDGRDEMDIVKVGYDLGKTKTGKPQLVITLQLAAPPSLQLSAYGVEAQAHDTAACGELEVDFRPGRALERIGTSPFEAWVSDCAGGVDLLTAQGEVKGSTIKWFLPFDSLKKKQLAFGKIKDIRAFTGTVDPVFGLEGNASIEGNWLLPTDDASTDKVFSYK
ncbi:MAG TPA: hypothetical protein VM030_03810 [Acidimicrobiales bacterium]|nr:hypothetical protein [Acidimicrobiales bacterium]